MQPIRTAKGKLYGTLDMTSYVLYIKDGTNFRLVKVPHEGLELQYISGNGHLETVFIPPKEAIYKT